MKAVRCAIYTRKSSEEGLEQDFNSLDAQREACAAYILSQASEGWVQTGERYDDGGLSGGTLARPALQRLLADVAAGRVDIIVVYKVDRLTRSLLDFSKLVEAFDAAGTSFVSITQSFNTTTSMGRLTLNMLLSFAQFEREVTAERIRDKIAASKARGMWMGGVPPLGYAPDGRSLKIVEEHAAVIRHIFKRYLALGNVRLLADELKAQHILMPVRTTASGKQIGGRPFSRGLLYDTLRRVTYDGQIQHCDKVFVGNHPAIIDPDTFRRVQAMLTDHIQGERRGARASNPALLANKLFDANGDPLISTHATKGSTRYRYYVSRALHKKLATTGMRVPARDIEHLVTEQVASCFDDPFALADQLGATIPVDRIAAVHTACESTAAALRRSPRDVREIVTRVTIGDRSTTMACSTAVLASRAGLSIATGAPTELITASDTAIQRSGIAVRLIHNARPVTPVVDSALIRLLIKARRWWREVRLGERNITELAASEAVSPAYVTRVMRLAFLAPDIVEAILAGRQRVGINGTALMLGDQVAARWDAQRNAIMPRAIGPC